MSLFYDEKNCLVNISNSILRYYQIPTSHDSHSKLDGVLMKNQGKKICVILLDGLGKAIQERYQEFCPFLIQNKAFEITSVFPPTTAAATTSLLSGLFPCETGWLGWTEKFSMYSWPIVMFQNVYDDPSRFPIDVLSDELCPYESVLKKIEKIGKKASRISSFEYPDDSISLFFKRAEKRLSCNDFLYIYHTSPDKELHQYGCESEKLIPVVRQLDSSLSSLVENHPDTLFLVLADHGHKDAKYFDIQEHEDFFSLLSLPCYSIEARAATFFVQEGKKDSFLFLAEKYYSDFFHIFSKEEVIEKEIFGKGKNCDRFDEVLGDFLLVSKGEAAFSNPDGHKLVSTHAGSSLEERMINVSLFVRN